MATLNAQQAQVTGVAVTFAPASSGGDKIAPGSDVIVLVKNGDTGPHTVTVVVPGSTFAQANPDVPVVVAAGATAVIGPFPAELADPTDRLVHLSYDAVTAVTVAAIAI